MKKIVVVIEFYNRVYEDVRAVVAEGETEETLVRNALAKLREDTNKPYRTFDDEELKDEEAVGAMLRGDHERFEISTFDTE